MAELIYGTSSWSERTWEGPFYPEGMKPGEYLSHYATAFKAVEADTTYYGIPRPQVVDGWRNKTPADFVMCAKFPRDIVHAGEGARPNGDVVLVPEKVGETTNEFLHTMARLGDKLGPMVLQFPYFNKDAFARPDAFYQRLDRYLGGLSQEFRYAVEVRNKWWVKQPLLDILARHNVAFVLVELGYMPHPANYAKKLDLVTADFVYARLIGDRKAVDAKTKTFDKLVLDKTPDIVRWVELLHELATQVTKVYAFANNHYAGHGPATIRELVRRIQDPTSPAPDDALPR